MNPFEKGQGAETTEYVPIENAVSNIIEAQGPLDLFPGAQEDLVRLLPLARDIATVNDADLAELNVLLRNMSLSVHSAQHAIKEGRSYFGVSDEPEHARLYGSEKIVKERTDALVAQKANIDAIKELAYAEARERLSRKRYAEE